MSKTSGSLKILHVIPAVAPRYGGPSQAIFEMCRALRREGVEVLLATTDADGPNHLPVKLEVEFEYNGAPTIFFDGKWGERFNYSEPLSRWLNANVNLFDLVHIHAVFSHPSLAAARACRKRGVPYIVRPLGSLDPWSMRQKPLRKRLMWLVAAARMLQEAASVHYTTGEEKKLAEDSLGLDRGVVIPLGVDLDEIQNRTVGRIFREQTLELGDNPYVLTLSRIHPKKNIELLIEAFLELIKRSEFAQWRLVIAGDGDGVYLAGLRKLVDELAGRDRILFAGWIEGPRKASAIQQASVFALPSRQENFGIAAVEALACGVPVVLSEHVNLASEITRANAGWVTPLDAGQLSRALAEAMSSGEERERRGRAGRQFVEQTLSWEKAAKELEKLYSSIIAETALPVASLAAN